MAGEEQEGSQASVEPRVSTMYMLLKPLSRSTGQPGESPERHQQDGYGGRVLQIVLRAASIFS